MNAGVDAVLGRAVFATTRGLTAEGTGVLAGADASLFEMGFGRDRESVFHKIEPGLGVYFARRLNDQQSGQSYNLFGALSPCRDSDKRRGFFGAAVSLPIDSVAHLAMTNWKTAIETLDDDFTRIHSQLYGDDAQINWKPAFPHAPRSSKMLSPSRGKDLFLHVPEGMPQGDAVAVNALQAMLYFHAPSYATICVFTEPMPDTLSLADQSVEDTLDAFDREQKAIATRIAEEARKKSRGKSKAAQQAKNAITETLAADDDMRRIEYLEEQVENLNEAVLQLQEEIFPEHSETHIASPNSIANTLENSPFSKSNRSAVYLTYALVVGGGIFLILILFIIGWIVFSSGSEAEDFDPLITRTENSETVEEGE